MSRQWHWLAATLLLITTAACSRPGTEEPDCPTKITLPPGATPTTTLDPRCIVRATTTGTADGDAASRWTGTVRIAGFYASICNAVWDGNVSLAGKDELTGYAYPRRNQLPGQGCRRRTRAEGERRFGQPRDHLGAPRTPAAGVRPRRRTGHDPPIGRPCRGNVQLGYGWGHRVLLDVVADDA